MSTRLLVVVASAPLLALAACGGGGHQGHPAAQHSSAVASSAAQEAPSASGPPSAAGSAQASGAATVNQQDIAFAQNMIMHHRQALEMAELAGTRSTRPEVLDIAASVNASQAPEIDLMSGWLGAWGAEVPEDMSQMDMSGSMPGMQSLAEMTELADLKGEAFDRKFLAMMTDHHEGAVAMAKQQLRDGADAEAKNLASQVIVEQSAEIDLMANLLK